jgi:hypothetical protein
MEELAAINLPTPMTLETRKLMRTECFDADKFMYGNNWLGTAAYYKAAYPGFDDDQCKAMGAFSARETPKHCRDKLKKEMRKQQQATCSGSRLNQSSSSALPCSPTNGQSINK